MARSFLFAGFVVFAGFWQLDTVWGDDKPAPVKSSPAKNAEGVFGARCSAVTKIEAELLKPTKMQFVQTPLKDVIEFLCDYHKIEIRLDRKDAMKSAGVAIDHPITVDIKGVSLESALNRMLDEIGLTWTIQDEVLLITAFDRVQVTRKVYDVADLVTCVDSHGKPWDDYETLTLMITTTILPKTWDHAGGPASIAGASLGSAKVLTVSHDYRGHREIAAFLADIRVIAAKRPSEDPPRRDPPPPGDWNGCRAKAAAPNVFTPAAKEDEKK